MQCCLNGQFPFVIRTLMWQCFLKTLVSQTHTWKWAILYNSGVMCKWALRFQANVLNLIKSKSRSSVSFLSEEIPAALHKQLWGQRLGWPLRKCHCSIWLFHYILWSFGIAKYTVLSKTIRQCSITSGLYKFIYCLRILFTKQRNRPIYLYYILFHFRVIVSL